MEAKKESPESPNPFCVWGVVNATPDSFFDGGRFYAQDKFLPELAVSHAQDLLAQGANVLDIGGASSRPGSVDVPEKEELARVLPLLTALSAIQQTTPAAETPFSPFSSAPLLSVDTWRASVAFAALQAGANIINDISGALWDPAMLDVLVTHKPYYVLMHCQGRPECMQKMPIYASVVDEVLAFLEKRMDVLVRAGLPEERIILDTGIGFGKTLAHNLALIRHTDKFLALGRPLLVGISQKSFFEDLLALPKDQRSHATGIATALLASRGIRHHRVHDVAGAVQALRLAHAFMPEQPDFNTPAFCPPSMASGAMSGGVVCQAGESV